MRTSRDYPNGSADNGGGRGGRVTAVDVVMLIYLDWKVHDKPDIYLQYFRHEYTANSTMDCLVIAVVQEE